MNVRGVYEFVASESTMTPFFANRINVSGDAGITGNEQDPLNWGPPTIAFPDFADLTRRPLSTIEPAVARHQRPGRSGVAVLTTSRSASTRG